MTSGIKYNQVSITAGKLPNRGIITWECPSNIALIKYWGKKGPQLPANPSLSMTLSNSLSLMELSWERKTFSEDVFLDFYFEGRKEIEFETKIKKYLESLYKSYPLLGELKLVIKSRNTFPHSSGIASSASSMGALALCINSLIFLDEGKDLEGEIFYRKASGLARLASGSASRSIFGDYVLWGKMNDMEASDDHYAIPLPGKIHKDFQGMRDSILIVNPGKKEMSSRAGHFLMNGNIFARTRYAQARQNLKELMKILALGDFDAFARVVENEALSLHAMMMTGEPSYILMEPATLELVRKIREYRKESRSRVAFTLDAGPNIHLLYPAGEENKIVEWLKQDLLTYCNDGQWIQDQIGEGPKLLRKELI